MKNGENNVLLGGPKTKATSVKNSRRGCCLQNADGGGRRGSINRARQKKKIAKTKTEGKEMNREQDLRWDKSMLLLRLRGTTGKR